jgi:hypothetical protein
MRASRYKRAAAATGINAVGDLKIGWPVGVGGDHARRLQVNRQPMVNRRLL